jgi:hydroxymethylpyrimidine kinase/phosphomethylpyrimidine kinase/thiamine-phosphate diphosphorylase
LATKIVAAGTIEDHTARASRPIVWSIAASDSGGGAGIQADLNTMHSLECHGCTVITAITAQNSMAVEKVHPISAVDLAAQWQALEKDLLPQSIKIGLLPEPNTLRWLSRHLKELRLANNFFCVWDPVLKASTGARFLDAFDRGEIDPLLKQVDLITPNLQEAEMLTKITITSFADIQLAAKQLLDRGVSNVLIKGGHSFDEGNCDTDSFCRDSFCRDYFASKEQSFWLCNAKQEQSNNHGTGCTLASAIASFVAKGNSLSDSVVLANRFVQQGLRLAAPQGKGAGPVWQTALENNPVDLAVLIKSAQSISSKEAAFPQAKYLGLYAIVNSLDDLVRLISEGVDTFQWRDKALHTQSNLNEASDPVISEEQRLALIQAITLCEEKNVPLYINDNWQLALEFNAYGVHLGQEDLAELTDEDLTRIHNHGLYLGISCHNETELAYAHSLKPSYLAFGPVFSPKSKIVDHPPLGLLKLKQWQSSYGAIYPTTCIGGIEQDNLEQVLDTGIQSIAVISALSDEDSRQSFIAAFRHRLPGSHT